jgi:hypothetical protein
LPEPVPLLLVVRPDLAERDQIPPLGVAHQTDVLRLVEEGAPRDGSALVRPPPQVLAAELAVLHDHRHPPVVGSFWRQELGESPVDEDLPVPDRLDEQRLVTRVKSVENDRLDVVAAVQADRAAAVQTGLGHGRADPVERVRRATVPRALRAAGDRGWGYEQIRCGHEPGPLRRSG